MMQRKNRRSRMEQENRMQAMQPEESKGSDDGKNGGVAVSRKTDFIPNPLQRNNRKSRNRL